jgi:hypothetical protein
MKQRTAIKNPEPMLPSTAKNRKAPDHDLPHPLIVLFFNKLKLFEQISEIRCNCNLHCPVYDAVVFILSQIRIETIKDLGFRV